MSFNFHGIADDFFVNLNLQTTMALPTGRETILHFCEAVQKEFPSMSGFYQRESGEFVLEADRESGSYRWLELQPNNLSAGYFNPPNLDEAYHLHRWLLERSVYFLGVSAIDVDVLDVLFGFNLIFRGNRAAIVAESLLSESPLGMLSGEISGRPVEFEPSLIFALDEECCLQARVSLETRTSGYQIRTGQYEDEPISVYLTVRGYPDRGKAIDVDASFAGQCELCEDISQRLVVPHIITPVAAAIATGQ